MKRVFRNLNPAVVLGLFFIISTNACNTPVEGCLDIRATNFSFDADLKCDDCCTFPKLVISLSHSWKVGQDSMPFRTNSVYVSPSNDTFLVRDVRFFISDISLTTESGEELMVDELEMIPCVVENEVPQDYNIVNLNTLNYTAGSFRNDELITTGSISMGLKEDILCAQASEIESGDLSASSTLYDQNSSAYLLGRWIVQRDTSQQIFDTIRIQHPAQPFDLNVNKNFKTGENDTLYFRMNYEKWFENVDLETFSNDQIATQFKENLVNGLEFIR